jgi:hypothetical protein
MRLSHKKPNTKRTGGVAQVIKCLLSKHEALSSNPAPPKKKKIQNKDRLEKS